MTETEFAATSAWKLFDVTAPHGGDRGVETFEFLPASSAFDASRIVVSRPDDQSTPCPPNPITEDDAVGTTPVVFDPEHSMRSDISGAKEPSVFAFTPMVEPRCQLIKKLDGFVVSRTADSFVGRFFDDSADHPALDAEIGLDELSDGDREMAVEGARLVWTIYYRHEGGTRFRTSNIYFRRFPIPSSDENERHRRSAAELMSDIHWE